MPLLPTITNHTRKERPLLGPLFRRHVNTRYRQTVSRATSSPWGATCPGRRADECVVRSEGAKRENLNFFGPQHLFFYTGFLCGREVTHLLFLGREVWSYRVGGLHEVQVFQESVATLSYPCSF